MPHPRFNPRAGIIPACAGSTSAMRPMARMTRDHPRMCGEHFGDLVMHSEFPGSSPHVRGAHVAHAELDQRLGIIPACAGSTS